MKDPQHYHSVAAAWLEAQCTTRGVRLQRELAHAICANLAKASMDSAAAIERADSATVEMHTMTAKVQQENVNLDLAVADIEKLHQLIRVERSWAWWRRAWRWVRFKACA